MATVNYFIRTEKDEDLVPVYCRIRSGRDVDQTERTALRIRPADFDNKNRAVRIDAKFRSKDYVIDYLDQLREWLYDELIMCRHPKIPEGWLRKRIDEYNAAMDIISNYK